MINEPIVTQALIVFVITLFLKDLDGPEDIFKWIRIHLCGYVYDGEEIVLVPDTFWAKLFNCFWCLSTWVSFFVTIYTMVVYRLPFYAFPWIWLGAIALAGFAYSKLS